MHIEHLTLKHFRNYSAVDLSFDNKINVIIGENAQGKTNLMEAMYTLAFTKSHRTSREKELIQWDADFTRIEARMTKRNQSFPLDLTISAKGKKARLNRLEQRRLSDYIGALNIIMFAPEDLGLVKGPPQNRRRFIDMELGQIQPTYIHHLGLYQQVLKQRNHLLKQLQRGQTTDRTMLHVLTEQLASEAAVLVQRRYKFLERLRTWAAPIHYSISHELENLQIKYIPTIEVSEPVNEEKIMSSYLTHFVDIEQKEVERGTTLIGPHRDDLIFNVNGRDVQTYGSQGQQRTTALSLKLAEIELIYNEIGEYPILLLDDVLSELDDHRQSHLLNTIQGKVQTFVSTTTVDGIHHQTLDKADVFHVAGGVIC